MLRVGLIGCGGIGAVHARCWLFMDKEVQLVAIADSNLGRAEKFKKNSENEIHTYASYVEMLESEVLDVVDICVPTFLHAELVMKAMEWVKNIIVEKPVCLTETEAEQLLHAEKERDCFVQVAHVVRFMDSYSYLKRISEEGNYGKLIAGSFSRISPRPVWMVGHDDVSRTGTMALDMHIHDADFIRYLMGGEPDGIDSRAVKDGNGTIQHIWSAYRYGDVLLTAEASWDYPVTLPFSQTFRVKFERAAVVLREDGNLTVYPDEGEAFQPEIEEKHELDLEINVSDIGPYIKEMKYFADRIIAGNKGGIAALSEAVQSLKLVKQEIVLAKAIIAGEEFALA